MNNQLGNTIHQKYCSGWCIPTVIYMVLSIISILLQLFQDPPANLDRGEIIGYKVRVFLIQTIIASLWTLLMYWVCSNCHENWAWFILLFPFLLGLLLLFFIVIVLAAEKNRKNRI